MLDDRQVCRNLLVRKWQDLPERAHQGAKEAERHCHEDLWAHPDRSGVHTATHLEVVHVLEGVSSCTMPPLEVDQSDDCLEIYRRVQCRLRRVEHGGHLWVGALHALLQAQVLVRHDETVGDPDRRDVSVSCALNSSESRSGSSRVQNGRHGLSFAGRLELCVNDLG